MNSLKKIFCAFLVTATILITTSAFADDIVLGRPTNNSITVNMIPDQGGDVYFEYGTTQSGPYPNSTNTFVATTDVPLEIVIDDLSSDTQYYYRTRFRATGETEWVIGDEYSFMTQRPSGSTFAFTIISDSHAMYNTQYQNAMQNVNADQPDFHLDLGDTFMIDNMTSQTAVNNAYLAQRNPLYMGLISHSVPIFLASGNHENEEGWNFDDPFSLAIASIKARKQYYPTPITDGFYSGNDDALAAIGGDNLREDYYAWEWGDVLFVVLDPFQYTMNLPYSPMAGETNDETVSGDRWNWTLGQQQFNWFKQAIQNSTAKYKFVFAHHMVGGTENYVRGGAVPAHMFEWGGYNADGTTWGFDTKRSTFGNDPIHQLMIDNGVNAFFHGHDHQYAYEERDGIVYQSLPRPSTGLDFNYYSESNPYTIKVLPNPGHLRVTVSPSQTTVDYVTSSNTSGAVNYSYTIQPNEISTDPTITIMGTPLSAFNSVPGTRSAEQSYTVSGSNLTDDITITAPTDFEISLASGSGFGSSVILYESSGAVAETTTYVRFNRTTEGTSNGNITHLSSGATTENVAVSGMATAGGSGSVTLDGSVSSNTADDVSSIEISHTTGTGTDRLMLVGVSWNCGTTARSISSVTFTPDGETAIGLTEVRTEQAGTQARYSAIYSLLAPPSGETGTVTVTFSGSVSNGIVAGVANFAGVDQTTPLGSSDGANENSTASSVTLTGLNGNELVFDNVFQGASGESQTLTVGDDQTEQWNAWIANARAASSVEQAAGDSVTMSWTAASSSYWAIVAVAINPGYTTPPVEHTITATAGANGTISPSGSVLVTEGDDQAFNITPDGGYQVADVLVDSVSVGAVTSYTFYDVQAAHTISATFEAIPAGSITYLSEIGSITANASGTTLQIPVTSGVAVGNTIIVGFASRGAPTYNEPVVTDSAGNTYNLATFAVTYQHGRSYIFYAHVDTALVNGDMITITTSSLSSRVAVAGEFSGLLAVDVLDQFLENPTGTSTTEQGNTPSVGPTGTTAQANELIIGVIGTEEATDAGVGTWINDFIAGPQVKTSGATNEWRVSLGYKVVSATGQFTAAKTVTNTPYWAASIATFKAAGTPVNTPPEAVDDIAETQQDTAVNIDVLNNDSDADSDPLSIDSVSDPNHGTAEIQPDDTVNYTPDAGYFGSDSFTYTISDGNGGSNTATVNVTVTEIYSGNISYIGDIGTATTKTTGTTLVITTTAVAAGDDVIVAFATYGDPDYTIGVVDNAGNSYEQAAMAICYEHGRTYIFAAYNVDAMPSGTQITITHTQVAICSAVASVFRGLKDIEPLDQSLGYPTTTAESGTTPSVGPTGTTAQADELVIGVIGTEGPVEDNSGTWDYSFTEGPRAGTTGGDADSNWTVSMGYRLVSSTGEYTAQKSGITDRYWGAAIATFKGVVMVSVPDVVGIAQATAESAITTAGLAVGTVTTAHSDHVAAGEVISQTPVAGTTIEEGSNVDLVVSLGLPIIPNVVGMTQTNAEVAIVAASFSVGTITTVYSNTIPAGEVISHNPVGGTAATSGTAVNMIVSLGLPIIPNVVGMTQANASTAIVAASFTVGLVTNAYSDTVPAGNVISQTPSAGTPIVSGTAVNIVISLGQPIVPNVVGFEQNAAQTAIINSGLSVGIITNQYSNTVAAGHVMSQNPTGGINKPIGTPVDLVISLGQPAVPDVVGMNETTAASAITAIDNLTVGNVTYLYSETVPAGIVISQTPSAGTIVPTGSSVDLAVSLGHSPRIIRGYVLEPDVITPIADVLIQSDSDPSAVTDPNGYYELAVDYGWSGSVTPSMEGYIFDPNMDTYSNVIEDQNDMDYIGTMIQPVISGCIIEDITPLADVQVGASDDGGDYTSRYGGGSVITDANGFYELAVDYNWTGDVIPSKFAYAFDPNKTSYSDVVADIIDQDYTSQWLTFSISGYILSPADKPIEGVSVQADNGGSLDITDANGLYEVWLDYNWSGTVTPTKNDYDIVPDHIDYANVLEDRIDDYLAVHYADMNTDGFFDIDDVLLLSSYWLQPDASGDLPGNLNGDDIVNLLDFALFAQYWLDE